MSGIVAPLPERVLTLIVSPRPTTARAAPAVGAVSARGQTVQVLIAEGRRQGLATDFIVDSINRRVTRYLETVGHCGEGTRDTTAFRAAAWLIRDFGLADDTALAYLREWNAGNAPPLPEWQLAQEIRSAHRSATRAAGCAHASRGRVA